MANKQPERERLIRMMTYLKEHREKMEKIPQISVPVERLVRSAINLDEASLSGFSGDLREAVGEILDYAIECQLLIDWLDAQVKKQIRESEGKNETDN